LSQIGMERNQTPMPHLGRMIAKFKYGTDFATSR
jgi:hypothetical protein